MKVCTECKEKKDLIEYHKKGDGYRHNCKICVKKYNLIYCFINKEKRKQNSNEWYQNNKYEKLQWTKKYKNEKRINDPLFKLSCNIRQSIRQSIKRKGYSKKSQSNKILGCSFEEFKIYLERKFTKGMNWENQGEWHLDHIYPVSLAKDEEEIIKLNHYTNFQPLWAIDNIRKGNKIIEKQLILL